MAFVELIGHTVPRAVVMVSSRPECDARLLLAPESTAFMALACIARSGETRVKQQNPWRSVASPFKHSGPSTADRADCALLMPHDSDDIVCRARPFAQDDKY